MSYEKKDGKIILTMSPFDYDFLLVALGLAAGSKVHSPAEMAEWTHFINSLNEGNPNYVAYAVMTEISIDARLNQFGEPVARAIPTRVWAWLCSECGATSYGEDGKPPIRCSNRRSCGKLFHPILAEDLERKEVTKQ